eukprot:992936-Pelagomonas_calceolata.AAC.3
MAGRPQASRWAEGMWTKITSFCLRQPISCRSKKWQHTALLAPSKLCLALFVCFQHTALLDSVVNSAFWGAALLPLKCYTG